MHSADAAPGGRPSELIGLHRLAIGDLDAFVATVDAEALTRPTPCEGWSVADLLAHSIGQHRGFAAVVRDGRAPASAYASVSWDSAEWRRSVEDLLAAFADADLDRSVLQVELSPVDPIPVARVVGAQLLDSAVHAWDLARALGRDYEPEPAVTASVLAIAERIPDGANREVAGAAFGHALGGDSQGWERVLRLLGRDPRWVPPAVI